MNKHFNPVITIMHVSMSLQGAVSDKKPLANDEHVSKLFPTVLRFDVCIC